MRIGEFISSVNPECDRVATEDKKLETEETVTGTAWSLSHQNE
jgi:hypothetical protein